MDLENRAMDKKSTRQNVSRRFTRAHADYNVDFISVNRPYPHSRDDRMLCACRFLVAAHSSKNDSVGAAPQRSAATRSEFPRKAENEAGGRTLIL